ncbi:MAG: cobalt-precorrin-6A reductase [Propionicimonas sp.]
MSLLLLGGTAEARELAGVLHGVGVSVMTSLAGDVASPRLPEGPVRIGGFGGRAGLATYLRQHAVTAVVDATHPFAQQITANAAAACAEVGCPLLRLSRPSWSGRADADSWHWVDSMAQARTVAGQLGSRVFLAIGRTSLGEFAEWTDRYVLARVVDQRDFAGPTSWEVLRARGPFRVDAECDLLRDRRIDVLVTKDSGGPADAKLDAACELGVPVVIVARPPLPAGVEAVTSVAEAAEWVQRRRSR